MTEHTGTYDPQLEELCSIRDAIYDSLAFKAKTAIQTVAQHCHDADSNPYSMPGDDCAAFPTTGGYQLLAMEGMLPDFVRYDPWHAGWSAVMANVSDIAAMGGRPTAVVNSFWHSDHEQAAQIISGIKHACDTFGLSLAGGHTSIAPQNQPGLAVAIMGFATHLLSCLHVQPGQKIYMVSDLHGEWHGDKPFWATIPGKTREQIRQRWDLLPVLAEAGLIAAAKDISNAGVFGTLLMLLEMNKWGAEIFLENIPRPTAGSECLRWLMAFQSYGFLLTASPDHEDSLKQAFDEHDLTCEVIGYVSDQPNVNVQLGNSSLEFWNLNEHPVTGLSTPHK